MEDWSRRESKGLRDGGSPESGEGNQFKVGKSKIRGLGEKKRQVRFPRKGFSIHVSPEYLKELKCKSQKLNPRAECTQRRLLQKKQRGSFSPTKQPWWEGASASTGFIRDGLRLVMRESRKACRFGSHKPTKFSSLSEAYPNPRQPFRGCGGWGPPAAES